jgi:hypothetical protein
MVAKPVVDRLQIHVTHACNLTCESCSHYSNHGHNGQIDPEDAERWFAAWSGRAAVRQFNLLGGEPTVHPRLAEFVPVVREHWPEARIKIITNGFFLDRHPTLPLALVGAGNCEVALSVHHDSPEYRKRIEPALDLLQCWRSDYGISFRLGDSQRRWTRRYTGFGDEMEPFADGDQRASWRICPARDCKQLHEGKIWKCAPIAYLRMQKQRFRLSPKWDPYLAYEPLAPDCDDAALAEFLRREDESICSMCSSHRRDFALPNPMRRVLPSAAKAQARIVSETEG